MTRPHDHHERDLNHHERVDERVEALYRHVQRGDHGAFEQWLQLVELPLRRSLKPFAAAVDCEAVLQEALLRMWVLAPRLTLEGPAASFKYALRVTRNLAITEARRGGREVSAEALAPAPRVGSPRPPMEVSDPWLRELLRACLRALPDRPQAALLSRLAPRPDRDSAALLNMTLNTFRQNIVRARRTMAKCLAKSGVELEEVVSWQG